MKYIIAFFLFLSVAFSAEAQIEKLKTYYFVLLKKGPHRDQDSVTVARMQTGHLANIDRLYKEGKIDLAGPFAMDGDWRGLFVFNVPTEEEVRKLLATDPAIAAGRLAYEIYPWMAQPGSCLRE